MEGGAANLAGRGDVAEWLTRGPAKPFTPVRFRSSPLAEFRRFERQLQRRIGGGRSQDAVRVEGLDVDRQAQPDRKGEHPERGAEGLERLLGGDRPAKAVDRVQEQVARLR